MDSSNVAIGLAFGGFASCVAEVFTFPIDLTKVSPTPTCTHTNTHTCTHTHTHTHAHTNVHTHRRTPTNFGFGAHLPTHTPPPTT